MIPLEPHLPITYARDDERRRLTVTTIGTSASTLNRLGNANRNPSASATALNTVEHNRMLWLRLCNSADSILRVTGGLNV
jgi:hypothetical protein